MKKTLVVLMAAAIMSIGAAQAATTSTTSTNPISRWLHRTADSITKVEQDTNSRIEADRKAAEEAKLKREKELAQRKAEREKAAAERKAAYEAQKKQFNDSLNQQKSFWKKLFTWDWN